MIKINPTNFQIKKPQYKESDETIIQNQTQVIKTILKITTEKEKKKFMINQHTTLDLCPV